MEKILRDYIDELEYFKFIFLEVGRLPTIQEDRRKHAAHEAACNEVKKYFQVLGYDGDLNDRQAIGKFVCLYEGRKDLIQWAN